MALNPEMLKKLKGKAPQKGVEVEIGIGSKMPKPKARPFGGQETPEEEALEGHEMDEGALPPGQVAGSASAEEHDLSAIPTDVLQKEMDRRMAAMEKDENAEGEAEDYEFPEASDEEEMA